MCTDLYIYLYCWYRCLQDNHKWRLSVSSDSLDIHVCIHYVVSWSNAVILMVVLALRIVPVKSAPLKSTAFEMCIPSRLRYLASCDTRLSGFFTGFLAVRPGFPSYCNGLETASAVRIYCPRQKLLLQSQGKYAGRGRNFGRGSVCKPKSNRFLHCSK